MSYGLIIAGQSHGVTANVNNCLCIFVMIVIKETGKILINTRSGTIRTYVTARMHSQCDDPLLTNYIVNVKLLELPAVKCCSRRGEWIIFALPSLSALITVDLRTS